MIFGEKHETYHSTLNIYIYIFFFFFLLFLKLILYQCFQKLHYSGFQYIFLYVSSALGLFISFNLCFIVLIVVGKFSALILLITSGFCSSSLLSRPQSPIELNI